MLNYLSRIKIYTLLIVLNTASFGQLETTVPAPTKKLPTDVNVTCDSPVEMVFPADTGCYVGEKVVLLTNDSLKGKLVTALWFLDSLIQTKYDEYRIVYLIGKDESTSQIVKSFVALKYGRMFTVPTGTFVRNKTLEHYKKLFAGKIFFPLEESLFNRVFLSVKEQMKDPMTGELFTLKRTDPLEFVKLTILDSVKSSPEIVAIFKVGGRHLAFFLSEFYPNTAFATNLEYFLLDKKDSDRIKSKFGQKLWKSMMDGEIQIGMTTEMVRIAWGLPDKINETVTLYGSQEQWVYGNKFVYFQGGKCSGWN